MKIRGLVFALAFGTVLSAATVAGAATITSTDGIMSIETPSDAWVQVTDPNYLFVISDGKSSIAVDHLSNGESLPAPTVADANYEAVYHAFVSTRNEVFIVKGLAAAKDDLQAIMEVIGTIKVLKYDTKTAITTTETPQVSSFGLREINQTYYSTTDDLRVRSSCSIDSTQLGTLFAGEGVVVKGAVTKDGADYGWYQIIYNGSEAYVSAQYLTPDAPVNTEGDDMVQCEYCGEWFHAGNDYRNHVMAAHSGETGDDMVQCEYCGEWFHAGNDYRNHVMAAHNGDGEEELVQCEYCGEWFYPGNDYRNHVMAAHPDAASSNSDQERRQCEICGEWFNVGDDFRTHLETVHNVYQ